MIKRYVKSAIQWSLFGPLFQLRPFDGWITHNILSSPKPRLFEVDGCRATINCANSHVLSFLNKWIASPHEIEARKWLKEYFNDGDVFLNVGSHIGTFVLFANAIKDLRHTIAIEASSPNVSQLLVNCQLNELENIHIIHCAAGDKNDVAQFNYQDVEPGYYNGRLTHNHYAGERDHVASEYVHIRTIDSILDELGLVPNCMLMDIDGHEVQALQGMQNTLRNDKLNTIIIETNHRTFSDVCLLLKQHEFQNIANCPDNPKSVANRLFSRN